MENFIVGIDIGTSKVCTLIGRTGKLNQLQIVGKGFVPCSGVRKGIIVDIESISASLKKSIEEAEAAAGVRVVSAFANIIASHVEVVNNRASIAITGEKREITSRDVEKVMQTVKDIPVPDDRCIIDVIPRQYVIDGFDEIVDPAGMIGNVLEVEADVVTAKITSVQNILKTFERIGIKIDGIVAEAFASGEIGLTPDEKEAGVVLIDIGGGITDISVFKNKKLQYYSSIPVGGDHITNDISIGLKIPYLEAEKIKRQYELALTSLIKNDQEVLLHDLGESSSRNVKVSEVVEIIEARVCEIFGLCRNQLLRNKVDVKCDAGLVLTGGGISYVDGNKQLASGIFNMPARVAAYKQFGISKPEYAVAAGIIKYISTLNKGSVVNLQRVQDNNKKQPEGKGFLSGFKKIIKSFF